MPKGKPAMKTTSLFALVAFLCASVVTTATFAQHGSFISRSAAQDDGVSIVRIKKRYDDGDYVPLIYRFPSRETIARAQGELQANSALRAVLVSKRVQLRNVVGIQTALNGGKVVYVR
jgi:hypothetical protein